MSDNVLLNPATSTGATIATDDIGGVHYQIIKPAYGPLDSATVVGTTAPLPVISSATAIQISNPTTAVSALITNTSSTAVPVSVIGTAPVLITNTSSTSLPVTVINTSGAALPTFLLNSSSTSLATGIWVRSTGVIVSNPTTEVSVTQSATANSVRGLDPLDMSMLATGSSYAPQYASIVVGATGNQTLVTNTGAGIKVTVLALAVISKTGADFYFQDGATTALFGGSSAMLSASSQGGFVLPYNPKGWFRTGSSANLLLFNNTVGSTIAGGLTYVLSS